MKEFWRPVREALGTSPLAEGMIGGKTPLFVERYLYRRKELPPVDVNGLHLITHLGGSAAQGGEAGRWQTRSLPTQSGLIPARSIGQWQYSGTVDFVIFYFADVSGKVARRLLALTENKHQPLPFNDSLVTAAAWRIVDELQRGHVADTAYLGLLAEVLLEQTWRALSASAHEGIRPRHVQAARLEAVFTYIRAHLAEDLSVDVLALIAGLSPSHFRHVFLQSTGEPPHRYILKARLEYACNLLKMSTLPLVQIAEACGFSSQSHMTSRFHDAYGATPNEFRAMKGRDQPA